MRVVDLRGGCCGPVLLRMWRTSEDANRRPSAVFVERGWSPQTISRVGNAHRRPSVVLGTLTADHRRSAGTCSKASEWAKTGSSTCRAVPGLCHTALPLMALEASAHAPTHARTYRGTRASLWSCESFMVANKPAHAAYNLLQSVYS